MKTLAIVVGSVALAVALVVGGLWAGTAWAQGRWHSDAAGYGPMGRGMTLAPARSAGVGYGWDDESIDSPYRDGGGTTLDAPCSEGWQGYGMGGMMGGSWSGEPFGSAQDMPFGSAQDVPRGEGWQGYGMGGHGMMGPGMMGGNWDWDNMPFGSAQDMPCGEGWQGYGMGGHGMMGPGMMGGNWDWDNMPFGSAQDMPCGDAYATPGDGEITSLEDVETAVHDYVERQGYTGLEVTEVMEFERNYYAIVAEEDTGIGAMEVLVDKSSGAVGPEPGPNMMWNAEYGMHRGGRMGMMGGYATGEMTLSPEEAQGLTQRWLDANLPGRTAGEADAFYGYYTLHFLNGGEIEGMLSVHGGSGDIWYHSWHGDFVAMIEGHD